MEQITNAKKENRLMAATLFVFFVSGASSMLMGNLMPFLREKYDISYAHAGLLLSLPSSSSLDVSPPSSVVVIVSTSSSF